MLGAQCPSARKVVHDEQATGQWRGRATDGEAGRHLEALANLLAVDRDRRSGRFDALPVQFVLDGRDRPREERGQLTDGDAFAGAHHDAPM
ncbi:hypothetical protein HH310_39725 [Actinoplanes sp. TBRC 11911]|nr:hypothetical protein [Actinoplanes sp. TBRC 11911]NMO57292.1 hypothetical protein [Actinoplanes sp. TBRC 11911]